MNDRAEGKQEQRMPRCIVLNKISADPWIKHFQHQAVNGGSNRSTVNKRYILVVSDEAKNKEIISDNKSVDNKKLPAIVSPVQQSVEQAEEQVRREATNFSLDDTVNQNNKISLEPKLKRRCLSGSKKSKKKKRKLVKDIFT